MSLALPGRRALVTSIPLGATHTTADVQRVVQWLQPLVEKHNRAVTRDSIARAFFLLPFGGLLGGTVLAGVGVMDDIIGLGGVSMLGMLLASLPVNLVTMNSTAFLSVDGKECMIPVRMPAPNVIEKLMKDFPHCLELALLHHVILDASVPHIKMPEE